MEQLSFDDAPEPERWLPVADYPQYLISDQGRFCKILKPWFSEFGYLSVSLNDGTTKGGKKRPLHQVVAEAFIGPRPPGQEVLHGPNGKLDNRASQLRYGTRQENVDDTLRDGTRAAADTHGMAKLTTAIVGECRKRYAAGDLATAMAAEYGVHLASMMDAICGRTWKNCPVPPVTGSGNYNGERHPAAKLTEAIIRECQARNAAGETLPELAREFGVTRRSLYSALIGETWTHLNLDRSRRPFTIPGRPKRAS